MIRSALDILNQALGLMAAPPVSNFDPTSSVLITPETEAAQTLAAFYDLSCEEAQSLFPWQELVTSVFVSPEPEKDPWGRYVYNYISEIEKDTNEEGVPYTECLRVLGVRRVMSRPPVNRFSNRLMVVPTDSNIQYELSANKIITYAKGATEDNDQIQVTFIRKSLDPAGIVNPEDPTARRAHWSPELCRVVIYTLAANGAFGVTQNGDLSMMLFQKLNNLIQPTAQFMQSAANTNERISPRGMGFVLPPDGMAQPQTQGE